MNLVTALKLDVKAFLVKRADDIFKAIRNSENLSEVISLFKITKGEQIVLMPHSLGWNQNVTYGC